MRVKNKTSHNYQVFPMQKRLDWLTNQWNQSKLQFFLRFCGFGLRYDFVGFCQELQPWLMTSYFAEFKDKEKILWKNQNCSIITNLNLKSLCWIEWDNFSMFFKQDNSLFSWLHFGLWPLSLAKPCFHSISSEPQRMNKLARTHAYSTNSRFYWHSYLVPAASSGKQPLIPSLDQKGQKGEGCHASFPMTPCLPVLT